MWIVQKESIAAVVRTVVPIVYGWLFTALGGIGFLDNFLTFIPDEPSAGAVAAIAGFVASVVYVAIRWLAEKWGWVGWFLVVNQKPNYAGLAPAAPMDASPEDLPAI